MSNPALQRGHQRKSCQRSPKRTPRKTSARPPPPLCYSLRGHSLPPSVSEKGRTRPHVTPRSRDSGPAGAEASGPAPEREGRVARPPARRDHAVPAAEGAPGQAERTQGAAGEEEARGYHCSDLPDRSLGGSPQCGEIGDVENWARSIELDMRTIATALEYVYKGQLQSAPS
ncbi:biogenesis of lysosome-related organelles complex 1 subunit 1 isoform X1 [Equus przewalskii]|uniref:Biogenesis of lysosome-related organelles complex 1 subunit 1 n=1 Tax=Equus przewalskii TaxID=9798 RepID=A0ABM4PKF6_EQUPR